MGDLHTGIGTRGPITGMSDAMKKFCLFSKLALAYDSGLGWRRERSTAKHDYWIGVIMVETLPLDETFGVERVLFS